MTILKGNTVRQLDWGTLFPPTVDIVVFRFDELIHSSLEKRIPQKSVIIKEFPISISKRLIKRLRRKRELKRFKGTRLMKYYIKFSEVRSLVKILL